ncbi:MAG TPA: alanine racemase [Myxococcota bacterium]|nr:alanine racemase [Myxococcota bacterium]
MRTLPTPCAVVDEAIVEANTRRVSAKFLALGVGLRPHVKTHKCLEAARLQVRGHSGAITVATLDEGRFFRQQGFTDITLAVPIALSRVPSAVALGLGLLVDSKEAVDVVRAHPCSVWLKVDCGNGRAGVDPHSDEAVVLARRLHEAPSVRFRGVLAHGGHSYACRTVEQVRAVAEEERWVTVAFAGRLRAEGIPVEGISIGSTPTCVHGERFDGVTEVRPGNYVFFDAFGVAIGSCSLADCAMTVVTSIIGVYPNRKTAICDAGALALSKDPGPRHVDPDCGHGVVCDLDGTPRDLKLVSLSQEHGKLTGDLRSIRVGDRLRIVPNHSCLAAALYPRYAVHRGGKPVAVWEKLGAR